MTINKILTYLFYFFTLLSTLGVFIHCNYLYVIAKIAILPCILIFYFRISKKINFFFLTVLAFFYVIDILVILEIDNFLLFAGILLNTNHVLLLLTAIRNTENIKIDFLTLAFSLFMFLLGFSIQYILYDLMLVNNQNIALFVIYSGILLCTFNSLALYNYLMRNSYINFYFGFGCLSIGLVYATFYVYKYVLYLDFLKSSSLIFEVIAYYLFVSFMLANEKLVLKRMKSNSLL